MIGVMIMNREKVKITERGWAGHSIVAHRCGFRRNTLLEYCDKKWIVSTVGAYRDYTGKMDSIGHHRWYETMVFEAEEEEEEGGYIDADVYKQIDVDSDWGIWGESWEEVNAICNGTPDNAANDMHERIVAEMMDKIRKEH